MKSAGIRIAVLAFGFWTRDDRCQFHELAVLYRLKYSLVSTSMTGLFSDLVRAS